ncbi:hypothetical protein PR003_g11079 [Phytophthora rubi]|uniref:Uncharacterized protein n=1 Tax=Phytophthora rubi TaxID=129364 RepID=A0A6A4FPA8_9STRA|nr:hypothetical protein PR001_g8951 [Phytophthora rubi]KAE9047201.1 hypothetical protein PR002_g1177 [Phytophthora rubi]KAE9339304.1 hypothetical protein PR003_g11079 [Phytophthora rubi]
MAAAPAPSREAAVYGAGARPSGARAELISDRSSKYGPRCDVTNLETLRHKGIVYTLSHDKEMGELKHSLRSLLKFAPWLEGPLYIVIPGQIRD